jgi:DNA-binding transcriptional ArsR family regulator
MNPILIDPKVHDASAAAPGFLVEVRADPAFEVLVGLSTLTAERPPEGDSWLPHGLGAVSPALRRAIDAVGRGSGEVWLHLLGVALDAPLSTAAAFVDGVAALDPLELRRHLVGVWVPSWRVVAGAETLEAAAAGERRAIEALLAHDRYYAGRARVSLERLLPLGAAQTKRRLLAVLRRFHDEVFAPVAEEVTARLGADAAAKRSLAAHVGPDALISTAARGFAYEREPEASRVVLAPHLAARPWLLLCQHRNARIICYPAAEPAEAERDVEQRVLALGRAVSDEARIRILRRLAAGEAQLTELTELTGLAKSTAHHHLTQLRAAGLVEIRGNARLYRYALRGGVAGEAGALLAELLSAPPS